jgi:hypothetical protein
MDYRRTYVTYDPENKGKKGRERERERVIK